MELRSVCVYCGASPGARSEYAETAAAVGGMLAGEGIRVVYGGGNVGLMGVLADGALAAGGEVVGVIPKDLMELELGHKGVTELHQVDSMHERKTKMADLSDAFVALPGGIGTMEEIFEVFTWTQLGFQAKPCAFLNVAGYYDGLLGFLDKMVEERFLKKEHLGDLIVGDEIGEVLGKFREYIPSTDTKWMDRRPSGR